MLHIYHTDDFSPLHNPRTEKSQLHEKISRVHSEFTFPYIGIAANRAGQSVSIVHTKNRIESQLYTAWATLVHSKVTLADHLKPHLDQGIDKIVLFKPELFNSVTKASLDALFEQYGTHILYNAR